ncbi:MAG TPA: sigma-54 dependent transcriptional regulator [Candidatus Aminicenantes bacterium]|nr:sigma-54 dependent transcriptional regulator [Candidatus Aminicenantes bacterium]
MASTPIRILIVDDDQSIRNMLAIVLTREGYQTMEAESGNHALHRLQEETFDLVISDIKMPDLSGIELLKKIKAILPELPVVMVTAYASTGDAVEAMKLGAEDYLIKPFNLDELKLVLQKSLHQRDLARENLALKGKLSEQEKFENIIGVNPRMLKIFELVSQIAATDSTVLITGESGTGKELIARAIHAKSNRASGRFVSVNCGALPENLLESELFGHLKGAFTDAYRDKEGLFELADRGTLFLDEIAEMSQKMQVKLLRTLQEKVIRRVGGNDEIKIDVRIIAATNRDLIEGMRTEEFRSDLYYRLNVISIKVPPLRERRDDIEVLMPSFLQTYNKKFHKEIGGFDPETIPYFLNYHWPGNVRELENFIERAVALERGNQIGLSSLPSELVFHVARTPGLWSDLDAMLDQDDFDFNVTIDDISRRIIVTALERCGGSIKRTADLLKLNYRSMRYLIEKFNLKGKSGTGELK